MIINSFSCGEYDIEIVVLALSELWTDRQRFFHDTLLVGVGDVLVTVTAEHIPQRKSFLCPGVQCLADTLYFYIGIPLRAATAGEGAVPGE